MDALESTRDGWAIIAGGVALFVGTMFLALAAPVPWGALIVGILGVPAGFAIAIGIVERRSALEYRREMRDLDNWYGGNR